MLDFSRAKAAAILLTVLVICGFMAPNFLSDETVKSWPVWAQHRIVLGPDLQGGTTVRLEVDRSDVLAQSLTSLRREVRGMLHEAHINLANPLALQRDSVEVRPQKESFQAALATLRELSQPYNGIRWVEVVDAGGGLIRLTPTEAALDDRERQVIRQAVSIMRVRMLEGTLVNASVEPEGARRILLQAPGFSLRQVTQVMFP